MRDDKTDSFAGQRGCRVQGGEICIKNNGFQTRHIPNARPGVAAYAAPPRNPDAQAAYGRERKETFPERKENRSESKPAAASPCFPACKRFRCLKL
jgi:hypothetical protein